MKNKFRTTCIVLYGIVTVLFLAFFIYMSVFENVSVYSVRHAHSYAAVENYSVEQISDASAPVGIHTVYRWNLNTVDKSENCLCFYVVHHYAQVFYDDILMYSLQPDSNNKIGSSISSNWVTVPVYKEDNGKEITVVLTPLYESVIDNDVEFLLGSHFSIIFDQLMQDLPQLFIALLCIILGVLIMLVQLYFVFHTNNGTWDMFFLGSFSALLGLWRITDVKSASLLFSDNPMVLGYITIGALFLCSIPLLLYISTLFSEKKSIPLLAVSLIGSIVSLLVLLFQVLGIAEFKESLVFSHIMLIAAISIILIVVLIYKRRNSNNHIHSSWKYFLLLAVGIVLDLVSFYVYGSSSNIVFTTLALILYVIIMFITNIQDTTQKAYSDSRTGLANKARWNDLMNDSIPISGPTCIMMMDLNGLKYINDKWGHEAGDNVIFSFANILRNTLPSNSAICRWGGDEFTVMINGINSKKIKQYVDALRYAVDEYNASCVSPSISYAIGWALSSEHPGLSRQELLAIADNRMYLDKQEWYAQNPDVFSRIDK